MTRRTGGAQQATPQAGAQRERILDAAQKCFIERGFHAASIARIAETAGMSAGLMYRYFENKNAIVRAIAERELGRARLKIADLDEHADVPRRILDTFEAWRDGDPGVMNAALYLEVGAEASRDPGLAHAVAASDAAVRAELVRWMARDRRSGGLGLAPEQARRQALLLQCLLGGLAVRAVREPHLELRALKEALDPLLRHLGLTPPPTP